MVIKVTAVTEVVIMTSFSKKQLDTLTTDQLSGQFFATLAMFFVLMVADDAFPLSMDVVEVMVVRMVQFVNQR